ncbi:DUF1508 domain-containing protein [Mesorhizobium sp. M9A.F.Ca.ET.002.03.1.2]|uniref:YegP family protein n=1 Tax=Mesorhizobium sp. M9A.F.Ca.ET.002.03.1.2 TaxID=2493668 RepID=UPI000F75D6F8|nr:DUF1508 domain-containing protein [Mesorhizobium sp. M9A.F.Ca.ET.002.03.1.2]AZN97181.1 DUF1508 domain-containing protein [Mesorhizobium sp. M9A.F.Ca.ET.002.03.1.2]
MHFHLYTDIAGYWRWTLYAANSKKIANSGEGYFNRTDCISAITLVKGSGSAPIKE